MGGSGGANSHEGDETKSHEWIRGISTDPLMPWLIPNASLCQVHGVKGGEAMTGAGAAGWGCSGPDLWVRWGFRSWTKGGIREWGRTHQQGNDVCKGMEWTSLEIRVKWPKISIPDITLCDVGVSSHSCGAFDPGLKSLDTGKPLPNLLLVWTRALLGD